MYIRLLLEGLSSVAIGFLVWGYIWYKLRKHALQKIDYVYAFLVQNQVT
jgi:hypothetical protein